MANAKFTREDVYNLGIAAGSFSLGNVIEGIHIVLPGHDNEGKTYNDCFKPLFKDYFDKIPNEFGREVFAAMKKVLGDIELDNCIGFVYMGAIQAFCADNRIKIGSYYWVELFQAVVKASNNFYYKA